MDPAQLEEERRLFYVAATRAKRRLYLSMARYRIRFNGGGGGPSPFLRALPADLVRLESGSGSRPTGEERIGGRDGHWQGASTPARNRSLLKEDEAVRQRPLGGGSVPLSRPGAPARRKSGLPLSGSEALLNKVSPFRKGVPTPPAPEDESQEAEVTDPNELYVNADVMHPTYGPGVVIHRVGFDENMKITVRFKSVGVKKLAARFARLRLL
jgi:DNA helicase-2/ATP-dependent DNA helicase PcrA